MPTLELSTRHRDEKKIRDYLKQLEKHGTNMREVFVDIGEYLQLQVDERFTLQRDPDGNPWAQLADASLFQRIGGNKALNKRGGLRAQAIRKLDRLKILTVSHRLRGSIIYRASETSLEQGTNVVYANIHQHGGKTRPHLIRAKKKKALFWAGASHPVAVVNHPGSNIPARPFLGLGEVDRQWILNRLNRYLR